ncbi:MAG: TrkH family potassium uptake protein [Acidiferrobacterales bacterium]|nr:TrkH family potassium uptake protein [Acidiferrobacterales bacterium]
MRSSVFKNLGVLLGLFSVTLLPPLAVSWFTQDGQVTPFLYSFLIILGLGLILWFPLRRRRGEMRFRDGFLIVVLFWVALSGVGAVPLWLLESPSLTWIEALFESMSGLSTTGATVLTDIDSLPVSILYYRQQLQWFGGMGIIVLAVAVMPMLGVGGMQLYRAETPGPVKDARLAPRIAETAKRLWYVYLFLTVACLGCYWLAGMSFFDAVSHAFSTVAIGGFSTHDASLAWFNSTAINAIAGVFMLLSGFNFALHYGVFKSRRISTYLADPESRVYLFLTLAAATLCLLVLFTVDYYTPTIASAVASFVQVISVVTTTGFATTDFSLWPSFLPILLILMSTAGGCAGSTAGGMKIIRLILLFKQGSREISRLVHPNAVIPIKLGGKPVPENVINAVWGFLSLYILSYLILLIAMLATGVDPVTAFSAVSACLNNLGPGLGDVAQNYASITDVGKGILIFAMLLGRLELFTLLVLFSPVFWRT